MGNDGFIKASDLVSAKRDKILELAGKRESNERKLEKTAVQHAHAQPEKPISQAAIPKPNLAKAKTPWEEIGITEEVYLMHKAKSERYMPDTLDFIANIENHRDNQTLYQGLLKITSCFSAYDQMRQVISVKTEKCAICDLPGYIVCPICIKVRDAGKYMGRKK